MRGRLSSATRGREGAGAGLDADPLEPHALFHRAVGAGAGSRDGAGERREVHMRGEVGAARHRERARIAMGSHGLEGVAGGALRVAVVDDERDAVLAQPRGEVGRKAVRAPLEHRADRRLRHRRRQMALETRDRAPAPA